MGLFAALIPAWVSPDLPQGGAALGEPARHTDGDAFRRGSGLPEAGITPYLQARSSLNGRVACEDTAVVGSAVIATTIPGRHHDPGGVTRRLCPGMTSALCGHTELPHKISYGKLAKFLPEIPS